MKVAFRTSLKLFLVIVLIMFVLVLPVSAAGPQQETPIPPGLTPDDLASYAGILLSLLFAYVPRLSDWYEQIDGVYKRLVMVAALLVVSLIILGLSCSAIFVIVTCNQAGIVMLVRLFVLALIANQATYLIAVRQPQHDYPLKSYIEPLPEPEE